LSGKPLKEIQLGVPLLGVAFAQSMIAVAAGEGLLAIEIIQSYGSEICPPEALTGHPAEQPPRKNLFRSIYLAVRRIRLKL
jgi:hypothetical protein